VTADRHGSGMMNGVDGTTAPLEQVRQQLSNERTVHHQIVTELQHQLASATAVRIARTIGFSRPY